MNISGMSQELLVMVYLYDAFCFCLIACATPWHVASENILFVQPHVGFDNNKRCSHCSSKKISYEAIFSETKMHFFWRQISYEAALLKPRTALYPPQAC